MDEQTFMIVISAGFIFLAVAIPFLLLQGKKKMDAWSDAAKKLGYTFRGFGGATGDSRFTRGCTQPLILAPKSRKFNDATITIYDMSVVEAYPPPGPWQNEMRTAFVVCEIVASHNFSDIFIMSKRKGFPGMKWAPDLHDMEPISLEGNFDKYFSVYTQKYKNSDALVFLTPDAMHVFIDNSADFHIEVAKNKFFIYAIDISRNPQVLEGMNSLAEHLVQKTISR